MLIHVGSDKILVRNNDFFKKQCVTGNQINIEIVKRVCHVEQVADYILKSHLSTEHGKGKKTHQELSIKVSNISRIICDLFCQYLTLIISIMLTVIAEVVLNTSISTTQL